MYMQRKQKKARSGINMPIKIVYKHIDTANVITLPNRFLTLLQIKREAVNDGNCVNDGHYSQCLVAFIATFRLGPAVSCSD